MKFWSQGWIKPLPRIKYPINNELLHKNVCTVVQYIFPNFWGWLIIQEHSFNNLLKEWDQDQRQYNFAQLCVLVLHKRHIMPHQGRDVNTTLLSCLSRSMFWHSLYTSFCQSSARRWRAATWTPAWACWSAWEIFYLTSWVSVALHVINPTSRPPADL